MQIMLLFAHITDICALTSFKIVRGCQTIHSNLIQFGNISPFGYSHPQKGESQSKEMVIQIQRAIFRFS